MRKYRTLRARMAEMDVRGEDLARVLLLSEQSISHRMTGRTSWALDEAYKVLDYLSVPHEQLTAYFPAGGRTMD